MSNETAQDVIISELIQEDNSINNDMLELMQFMKYNGTPLTDEQVRGIFILNEVGLSDIASFANVVRPNLTTNKVYYDLINKITLADRIKGTARLDKILKAQVANPNQQIPSSELQPKALRERELNR